MVLLLVTEFLSPPGTAPSGDDYEEMYSEMREKERKEAPSDQIPLNQGFLSVQPW